MPSLETRASPPYVDVLAVGHAPILAINRRIYRAILKKGWRIELAIPAALPRAWGVRAVQPDDADDPPIHRLSFQGSNTRYWSFDGMKNLLQTRRPRIIYLENEPDSVMAYELGRWCRRNGASLVVNSNENDIPPILVALLRRGLRPALRSIRTHCWSLLARRYVTHVVSLTSGGREAMQEIGFGNAVTVAPLGFDQRLFYADETKRNAMRARIDLQHPTVAYFGRLTPQKGIHVLIEALSRLKNLPWQFLIEDFAQEPDDYAMTLSGLVAKHGLKDRTRLFTATHEEIPDFMRAADIVVLPSVVREQYGRVVGEAMACGCAVVVSDLGALPELVGSAGLVTPANDVAALSEVLSALLSDHDRRIKMRLKAARRAREFLSMERQVGVLDQLFHDLRDSGFSRGPQSLG